MRAIRRGGGRGVRRWREAILRLPSVFFSRRRGGVESCPRESASDWLTGWRMRRWGIYGGRKRLLGLRGSFGRRSGRALRVSAHAIAARRSFR